MLKFGQVSNKEHYSVKKSEGLKLYQRETLTLVFSFEFCEIFRNSYFVKYQQTTTLDCWSFLIHSLKSVRIRSFFWSVFSCIRSEYVYLSVFSLNAGKNGPEKTPYLDTFHVVIVYERSHGSWHQIVAALLENLQHQKFWKCLECK